MGRSDEAASNNRKCKISFSSSISSSPSTLSEAIQTKTTKKKEGNLSDPISGKSLTSKSFSIETNWQIKRKTNDNINVKENYFHTTPADKFSSKSKDSSHQCCSKLNWKLSNSENELQKDLVDQQIVYLKHNLHIKSCLYESSQFPVHLRYQMQQKKVSLRNYTPKILDREINMGMWI